MIFYDLIMTFYGFLWLHSLHGNTVVTIGHLGLKERSKSSYWAPEHYRFVKRVWILL